MSDKIPPRIIARLDIKGPTVVKGVHLEGFRKIGDPNTLATQYYNEGADEILFMDIVASLYGRNNVLDIVKEASKNVFIPMTVGGGIRTIDDITAILRSGADKVAINTAAIADQNFVKEAARIFGSQCIVLSIEAKRQKEGHWEAFTDSGRERTGRDAVAWAEEAEALGIGEILVTSIDQEGTKKGFDVQLSERIRSRVKVPVIVCGGGGTAEHVVELFSPPHADAVCCATIFHYNLCSIPELKNRLVEAGVGARS